MLDQSEKRYTITMSARAGGLGGGTLEVRSLTDIHLIRKAMLDESMCKTCIDGVSKASVVDKFLADPSAKFIGVFLNGVFHGLFIFHRISNFISAHAYMLPSGYGEIAKRGACLSIKWANENMAPFETIQAIIPAFNRHSIKFAERLGFRETFRFVGKWPYQREMHDAVIMTFGGKK